MNNACFLVEAIKSLAVWPNQKAALVRCLDPFPNVSKLPSNFGIKQRFNILTGTVYSMKET